MADASETTTYVTREGILAVTCPRHQARPGEPCPPRPRPTGIPATPCCQHRLWVAQAAMNGRWPEPARRLTGPLRERFAAAVAAAVPLFGS